MLQFPYMTKFLFVSLFIAFCSLFFAPAAQAAANPALPASFQDRIDSRGQDQNANIDKFSKENFESLGISLGCAITGGAFYNPSVAQFPAAYTGSYFFADYCGGWINRMDPANGYTVST